MKPTAHESKDTIKWVLVFAIMATGMVLALKNTLNYDVSWLVYVTQEYLGGEILYKDLFLVNPPISIWINIPAVIVANLFDIPLGTAFKIYVGLLGLGSIGLCYQIVRHLHLKHQVYFIIAISIAFFILPSWNFGQREHLAVIFSMPYIWLILSRANGTKLPLNLVILAGICGVIGFNIKPYFLIVPVFMELYLIGIIGFRKLFTRIEPYIIGFGTILYLGLIWLLTPNYFSAEIFVYAKEIYNTTFVFSPGAVLYKINGLVILLALSVAFWLVSDNREKNRTISLFLIASFAMLCVVLIQSRGWASHQYPIYAFLIIAICGILTHDQLWSAKRNPISIGLSVILSLLFFNVLATNIRSFPNTDRISHHKKLQKHLVNYPDTQNFFIMSSDLHYGFPLTTEMGLEWGSGLPCLWLSPGIQKRRKDPEASQELLDEIEIFAWEFVAKDLNRKKPDTVFVDVKPDKEFFVESYDYIEDFSKNSAFRKAWSQYDKVGEVEGFEVYRRKLD